MAGDEDRDGEAGNTGGRPRDGGAAARFERQSAALRANLRRRKAQQQGRREDDSPQGAARDGGESGDGDTGEAGR